jgi:hypothetical protein
VAWWGGGLSPQPRVARGGGWTGPEGWDAVGGRRLTDRVSERGGCRRMNPTGGGGRLKGGVTEDEAGHTFSLLQKIRFLK